MMLGQSARRIALGLTVDVAAKTSGLHRNYLAGIEAGEMNCTLLSLRKIASALECSASQLLQRGEVEQSYEIG